jgi:rubrerythrin
MLEHELKEGMSPEQILHHVQATERQAHALLERAAHLTADPDERRLFERLAAREQDALRDLAREEERLDAEAFVQRALDC